MQSLDESAIDDLRRSLGSLQKLRRSAIGSIALMAVGIATMIGATIYAGTVLGPLEKEREQLEEEIAALTASRSRMVREGQADAAALDATRRQLDSIQAALRQLSSGPLSAAAQSQVNTVLRKTERAEQTVAAAEEAASPPGEAKSLDDLVSALFSPNAATRVRAYDALMAQHGRSPQLVPAVIARAEAEPDNMNGVYNALVVLNTVNAGVLRASMDRVVPFAASVKTDGRPRIAEQLRRLRERLPASAG
ncbi:MAG TPA: hypothetical protein VFQ45_10720 [Longimicrobium sp.]|nr:hypothetical protein [Longimicrobium sp.]